MLQLDRSSVIVQQLVTDKTHALTLVAEQMQALGLADNFLPYLLGREAIASTYLGAGIAIPHGTPEAKNSVQKTGVAVVHFEGGVDWGNGNTVYVAVGICAKSDEHLDILRQIARLLDNDRLEQQFKNIQSSDEVVALLTGQPFTNSQAMAVPVFERLTLQSGNADDLLKLAHSVLREAGVVSPEFAGGLKVANWLKWSDGVWCVQTMRGVSKTAVALVGSGSYENQAVEVLAVVAQSADNPYDAENLLQQLSENYSVNDSIIGQTILLNAHGLHARPATFLSKLAGEYAGKIELGVNGDWVSAKSLSKLLSLGVVYGQAVQVRVTGQNASDWLAKITDAIDAGLGEEVSSNNIDIDMSDEPSINASTSDNALASTNLTANNDLDSTKVASNHQADVALLAAAPVDMQVACKGIGVGVAFVAGLPNFDYDKKSDDPTQEKQLLAFAINKTKQTLNERIKLAKSDSIAEIFSAHLAMLDDEELQDSTNKRIEQGLSAAAAFDDETKELAKKQASLANPILAQRAADWYDIGGQVLSVLCGTPIKSMPDEPFVFIKDELLPSDVATFNDKVVGIITAHGGANSHSAIIARSLGIPMLVGAGEQVLDIAPNQKILVNGETGQFVVSPSDELLSDITKKQSELTDRLAKAKQVAHEPATTTDGRHIEVAVNLGDVADSQNAVVQGADGVGLLRTEFVFMKHKSMPNKSVQMSDYTKVFETMGQRPVVVRTLDVGGDKPLPYLPMPKEENPFLGVRGIRLSLQNPDSLRTQVAALIESSIATSAKLGTAQHTPLRIMFPMVGQLAELMAARAIVDEVLAVTPHNNLQVGMMIEVPSAAILADKFAPLVDFFSIGTNDLTQYALAIDRGHPALSAKADGLDPSILRFIELTIRAAHYSGKWVGVCGELAADELAVPVLVGLGVDELSVSANQIALVKSQIRTLDYANCQKLADKALIADSGQAVRALVKVQLGA